MGEREAKRRNDNKRTLKHLHVFSPKKGIVLWGRKKIILVQRTRETEENAKNEKFLYFPTPTKPAKRQRFMRDSERCASHSSSRWERKAWMFTVEKLMICKHQTGASKKNKDEWKRETKALNKNFRCFFAKKRRITKSFSLSPKPEECCFGTDIGGVETITTTPQRMFKLLVSSRPWERNFRSEFTSHTIIHQITHIIQRMWRFLFSFFLN